MTRGWLTAALLCLLAGPVVVAEEPPTTVREGRWFRVVCHFAHAHAADGALAAVEAVGPLARDLYGLREPGAGGRLEVHLYRTVADYEAAEQELTGGRFKRNLAFAHHASKSAHVALQPPLSDEALDRIGLPHLTENLLAHEASHVIRYRAMPSFRSHPMWLVDGAAIWLAVHAELQRQRIGSIEACPLSATEIVHGQRLLAAGRLPSADDLFHDRTDDLSFYERYAARWLFFEFLIAGPHAAGARRAIRTLRSMGGGADLADRLKTRVVAETAPTSDLDDSFRTWLEARRPAWREVYRALDTRGDTWTQAAFPSSDAITWRTAPVGGDAYDLGGGVEVLPGANVQMNVLLDHTPAGFVSVALRTDGWLTVFDYDAKGSAWRRLGSTEHDALRTPGRVAFRIRVARGRLQVLLGGQEALDVDVSGRAMDGPWGLGAQAGTCGLWHDVTLTPMTADARRSGPGR